MPVNGRVKHAYGQPRTAGLRWQGWLIGAPAGAEVKAIAYGRVAYSDWLRGYGLLMIIEHGDGFMSLYANNESLVREEGDWVEPGASISTVGSSPVNGTGLYFEIRKNGKAMDPAVWLKR
jgi:septal ring factor EnvC (AmiA/AmiB activator)